MGVEDLPPVWATLRHVRVASSIGTVIGDQHKLKHMVMQGLSHLVKSPDIAIECGDGEHIRYIAQVAGKLQVCSEPYKWVKRQTTSSPPSGASGKRQ